MHAKQILNVELSNAAQIELLQFIETKPANVTAFLWTDDFGHPIGNWLTDVGGGYPVILVSFVDDVVYAKNSLYGYFKVVLIQNVASDRFFAGFVKVDGAAGELPFADVIARTICSLCQKIFAIFIYDNGSSTDTYVIDTYSHDLSIENCNHMNQRGL